MNKFLLLCIISIFLIALIILGGRFVWHTSPASAPIALYDESQIDATATSPPSSDLALLPAGRQAVPPLLSMERNVPFTSQAPFVNWDNIIFQQGCEEASMLMAMLWVERKSFISPSEAEKAISSISNFSQRNYGEFRDTSAWDTAKIMRGYFDYENIEVKSNIDSADIKRELANGNLVIVPVNGQKLGNPFYTPPGPIQHMLVVRGYDADKKEFIVNDPGTKRGESFRYKEEILGRALQDYVTGYKEPILNVNRAMIIVYPRPA